MIHEVRGGLELKLPNLGRRSYCNRCAARAGLLRPVKSDYFQKAPPQTSLSSPDVTISRIRAETPDRGSDSGSEVLYVGCLTSCVCVCVRVCAWCRFKIWTTKISNNAQDQYVYYYCYYY